MKIWLFVTIEHKSFPLSSFDWLNDLSSFLLHFLSFNNELYVPYKKILIKKILFAFMFDADADFLPMVVLH